MSTASWTISFNERPEAAGEVASAIAARTIGDRLCAHTGDSDGCAAEQSWFLDAFADAEKSIAEEAADIIRRHRENLQNDD